MCGKISSSEIVSGKILSREMCLVGFCPVGYCLAGFCPVGLCLERILSSGIVSGKDFIQWDCIWQDFVQGDCVWQDLSRGTVSYIPLSALSWSVAHCSLSPACPLLIATPPIPRPPDPQLLTSDHPASCPPPLLHKHAHVSVHISASSYAQTCLMIYTPNNPFLGYSIIYVSGLTDRAHQLCESMTGYTSTPCVGYFTSPGNDTRQKGPTAFSVSSTTHKLPTSVPYVRCYVSRECL